MSAGRAALALRCAAAGKRTLSAEIAAPRATAPTAPTPTPTPVPPGTPVLFEKPPQEETGQQALDGFKRYLERGGRRHGGRRVLGPGQRPAVAGQPAARPAEVAAAGGLRAVAHQRS